jgi:PIN domain nuclease of toxin-antitoxin system
MARNWLLDTHVWLWMQQNPDRFAPQVRERLENQEQTLFLSVASV